VVALKFSYYTSKQLSKPSNESKPSTNVSSKPNPTPHAKPKVNSDA